MNYPSIRIEGGILSPDIFDRLDDAAGQQPVDFGLESTVKVKDEIARAWADAQDYWRIFQRKLESLKAESPATTETRNNWIVPLLGLLGYQLEYQAKGTELNGKNYPISHRATIEVLPLHTDELFPDLSRLTDRAVSDLEHLIHDEEARFVDLKDEIDDLSGQIRQNENTRDELNALFGLGTAVNTELDLGLSARQQQRQQLQTHQDMKCPFGGVLIKECNYVIERQGALRTTELQDAHAMEQAEAARDKQRNLIAVQKSELTTTIEQLTGQRKKCQDMRDSLEESLRVRRSELKNLRDARQGLETWTQRRDQGTDYPELTSLREQLETTKREMEKLESDLTERLRQHDDNRDLLASIFSTAVRAVLPSGTYDGQVSLENRELAFRITHGPAMSGEAIETLSVLLSDIATQVYSSVSVAPCLPGFLLHDSPREADLGARLYRSFIRSIAELQSHFGSPDACPFQYILTTTTPPPKELRNRKFVKLPLNAGILDGLLLRRNIAEPPAIEEQTLFDSSPRRDSGD